MCCVRFCLDKVHGVDDHKVEGIFFTYYLDVDRTLGAGNKIRMTVETSEGDWQSRMLVEHFTLYHLVELRGSNVPADARDACVNARREWKVDGILSHRSVDPTGIITQELEFCCKFRGFCIDERDDSPMWVREANLARCLWFPWEDSELELYWSQNFSEWSKSLLL